MQRINRMRAIDSTAGATEGRSAGLQSPRGYRVINRDKSQAYIDAYHVAFEAAQQQLVSEGPLIADPVVKLQAYYYIGNRCGAQFSSIYCDQYSTVDVGHFQQKRETIVCSYVEALSTSDQDFSAVYFRYGFDVAANAHFESRKEKSLKRAADSTECLEERAKKKRKTVKETPAPIDWQYFPVDRTPSVKVKKRYNTVSSRQASMQFEFKLKVPMAMPQQATRTVTNADLALARNSIFRQVPSQNVSEIEAAEILATRFK